MITLDDVNEYTMRMYPTFTGFRAQSDSLDCVGKMSVGIAERPVVFRYLNVIDQENILQIAVALIESAMRQPV